MKAVILAGGSGTRLHPLTKVCNKCLLPVYNRPMIYWPIKTLVDAGINDILIVCGGNSSGQFLQILGNGEEFGIDRLYYKYQSEPRGIADALKLARSFAQNDCVAVILADNIFQDCFAASFRKFEESDSECKLYLKPVKNPQWYGVAETDSDGNVLSIEEKPKNPKSNCVVTGLYLYKPVVWDLIDSLTPSQRGELEITDLNNIFLTRQKLVADTIDGFWGDGGESIDVYTELCYNWMNICRQKL